MKPDSENPIIVKQHSATYELNGYLFTINTSEKIGKSKNRTNRLEDSLGKFMESKVRVFYGDHKNAHKGGVHTFDIEEPMPQENDLNYSSLLHRAVKRDVEENYNSYLPSPDRNTNFMIGRIKDSFKGLVGYYKAKKKEKKK